ncbi:hypothetical protein GWI34_05385 [Actinomadura sp. DSM 109109]|nr:hypothetical protein [Actinomadura lepetitiana]
MLNDWYFCTALQLPPQQTAVYLEVADTFRHGMVSADPEDEDVLTEAVTMLTGMGQWRLLHALPLVLALQHRRRPDARRTRAVLGCCATLVDTCVSRRSALTPLYELLRRVVDGSSAIELAADIADQAGRLLRGVRPSPPAAPATPYLDLVDFAVPTILITMLDALSRRDPASVRARFPREDPPQWFARALRGEYGRQAQLLAVETATRCGSRDAREELTAPLVGVPDLEPDLMACYARTVFAPPREGAAERERSLDALEAAAVTGGRVPVPERHPRLEEMRGNVLQRLGSGAGASPVLTSVLWQVTLWEIAAAEDPAGCADRLGRWWGPPPEAGEAPFEEEAPVLTVALPQKDGRAEGHLANLLWLRTQNQKELFLARERYDRVRKKGQRRQWLRPRYELVLTSGAVSETPAAVGAAICSPWTYRRSDIAPFGTVDPAAFLDRSLFPGLHEPVALIRLCACAALAVRLLRLASRGAPPPGHLMALLMHAKDVLNDYRLRALLERVSRGKDVESALAAHIMVPQGLYGLLLHVMRALDHAGKGSYQRLEPEALADFLLARGPDRDGSGLLQERQLFDSVALGLAVGWVKEIRAGFGTEIREARGSARWLERRPPRNPPALRVLKAALATHAAETAPLSATLLKEVYPREFEESRREEWNWIARRERIETRFASNQAQGRKKALVLNANTVLCAPPYTVEQWRDVLPEVERWLAAPDASATVDHQRAAARTMVLAARLGALLRSGDEAGGTAADDWSRDFVDRVDAMVDRQELGRDLRHLLIEWIPDAGRQDSPRFEDLRQQARLGQVLTLAVDAIVEFSSRAPRYVLLLLERLRTTDLPVGMANDLRHRVLRGVLRDRWHPDSRDGLAGPLGRVQARLSAADVDREVSRFVRDMSDQRLPHLGATLGEAFTTLWHDLHLDAMVRPVAVGLGTDPGETVDRRIVWSRAVLLDRHRDVRVHYPVPVDPRSSALPGGSDEPVASLFGGMDVEGRLSALVLGVVCGVERGMSHGGDDLLVNCGLDGPLRVESPAGADAPMGDLRAVRLVRDDPADAWKAHGLRQLRPASPVPGERRSAVVVPLPKFPRLRVEIDGEDVYPADDSERATQIRTAWDPDLSRGFGGFADEPVEVPARYDGKLAGWLPVDRGLTELLAARSEDGVIRLTYAGPGPEDTGGATLRRFVTAPGRAYLLSAADWADGAGPEALLDRAAPGLVLLVRVGEDTASLTLAGEGGSPVDDRNREWQNLLPGGEHAADRTDEGWTVEVPAPDGFPRTLLVDGLPDEAGESRLFFEVTSWTEYDQRRCKVKGKPLITHELTAHDKPSLERLNWLRDIRRGDELILEGLIRLNTKSLSKVRGPDGVVLSAETQSLTLLPVVEGDRVHVGGRKARVISVSDKKGKEQETAPSPAPLSHRRMEELLAGPGAAGGPVVGPGVRKLEGAVVQRLHTRRDGRDFVIWGIWLEVAGEARFCCVPESAFRVPPVKLGIGDLLTASRGAGGWTFEAARRTIKVRSLYRRVSLNAIPERARKTVGYDVDGTEVVQDLYGARLAFVPAGTAARTWFEQWLAGLEVESSRGPFGPGGSRQGVNAVGESGGRRQVLQGWTAAYREDQVPSVRAVLLRVGETSRDRVEVEREFVCDLRPRTATGDAAQAEIDEFLRREARGDLIVTGALQSGGLRVGSAVRLPDGRYGRVVPRVDVDHQWIPPEDESDGYPFERVRALLIPAGEGYRASCRAAPPLGLQEFRGEIGAKVTGRRDEYYRMPPRFRYVGMETDGEHRNVHTFEWGHGWRLAVPDERLRRETRDGRKLELFHGDMILGAVLRPVRGRLEMRLGSADVVPGLPNRLLREARNLVVHEVDVAVDPRAETVEVRGVLTGGDDPARGSLARRAGPVPVSAQLDGESRDRLLAEFGDRPPSTMRIFARLDQRAFDDPRAAQGRRLVFAYVPAVPAEDGRPGLRKGERIFLLSGRIRPTGGGNDAVVEFVPLAVNGQRREEPRVVVTRRSYSYRENLLPKLYELQEAGEPVGAQVMLVRLIAAPEGEGRSWSGETKRSEPRPLRGLVSVLEAQHGSGLATVVRNDEVRTVELRPGALYDLEGVRLPPDAQPGAAVRLSLGPRRAVTARLAIPSDLGYIPESGRGRPVVVLPKSPLLRKDAFDYIQRMDSRPGGRAQHYTVAGLPGAEVKAPSHVSKALLGFAHPKTTVVLRKGDRVSVAPGNRGASAGRIEADPATGSALFVPLPDTGRTAPGSAPSARPIAWAQMSFADTGTKEIARSCRRGTFRYTDARTGHWASRPGREGAPRLVETRLDEPRGADEVVFAAFRNGAPTLRYRQTELFRFGFPADHLLDEIAAAPEGRRTFTVAQVAQGSYGARGLWLELRPGHLAELTGEILLDGDGRAIGDLRWSWFSPGDRVRLSAVRGDPGSIPSVRLERWIPGPRGSFAVDGPEDRVLLPVRSASEKFGSLSLGAGRCRLTYPAGPDVREAFPAGGRAWLTGGNELTGAAVGPGQGDVVLLGLDEGRLIVHGMPEARPEPSRAEDRLAVCWPDRWLLDALDDRAACPRLMDLLGGALTVTVEEAEENPDGTVRMVVSRRRQPMGRAPRGALVWARHLGGFDGRDGRRTLLAAGGALLAVEPDVLAPGIPPDLAGSAWAEHDWLWVHTDEQGRLHAGRPGARDRDGDITVTPRRVLSSPRGGAGLVCEEEDTSAYRWLPADQAGWTALSVEDMEQLVGRRIRVAPRRDGTVSLTRATAARRMFDGLSLGSTVRVDVLDPGSRSAGRQGLGRVHLSEMLIRIAGVDGDTGTALLAEVSRHRPGDPPEVSVVPLGRRRIIADLPLDIVRAMHRLARWNREHDGPADVPELGRFHRYDLPPPGSASPPAPVTSGERVVWIVDAALAPGSASPGRIPFDAAAEQALDGWWAEYGDEVAGAAPAVRELDFAPALAACLLLDARGARDAESARDAVRFARRLGQYAERSMHVEPLASLWLGREEQWDRPGAWERLRRLLAPSPEGSADEREVPSPGAVHDFARSVLERTDPRAPGSDPVPTQSELAPIARALLAAVGALAGGDHLVRDAPMLARMVGLGRGLTPGAGREAAQPELLECQRVHLRDLFVQVARSRSPIILLPPVPTAGAACLW